MPFSGRSPKFLSIVATCAALCLAGPAMSQMVLPGDTVANQRTALEQALKQSQAARKRSESLEQRAASLKESAEKARREAEAVAARIQESEASIAAGEARLAIIGAMQKRQRARLSARQRPIVRLTGALQSLARRPAALALVQPGSIEDVVHVRALMGSVVPVVQQRTAALRADVERGKRLRRQEERATALLRADRARLAQRRQQLAAMETRRRIESQNVSANADLEGQRALSLSENARDLTELVDTIETNGEVREKLVRLEGPLLRPARPEEAQTVSGMAPDRASRQPAYRLPVVGQVVTGLGEVAESGFRSRGLTIATAPRAQVVAPASGRVSFAGPYSGFGNIIIIEHDGSWTTLITSLARLSVSVGDRVRQGAPLGVTADRRPTVTLELRRKGRPIDILALVSA